MPKTKRYIIPWIVGWLMVAVLAPLVLPCLVLALLINNPFLGGVPLWAKVLIWIIALFMGYSIHRGVTEPAFTKRVDKITQNIGETPDD